MTRRKVRVLPGAPMVQVGGCEPLEAALDAVIEICELPQSDAVKLRAMEFVQALAKNASITTNISDCSFESGTAGTCVQVSAPDSRLDIRDSSFNMKQGAPAKKKRGRS